MAGERVGVVDGFDAMGRMAGAVAHDFNNLLTGILGNLELMQRRATRLGITDFDDYLRGSRAAANRAVDLTQRLVAVSGHLQLEPKRLDAAVIVGSVVEIVRGAVGCGVRLAAAVPDDFLAVRADEGQLEDALLQLVRNADTALGGAGGDIIVGVRRFVSNGAGGLKLGDYGAFSVTDTGHGMPPEVAARAFEPFFTTRNSGAGCGLGLAAVQGFARQSGGHAAIEETTQGRTRVSIFLPAVP